MSSVHIGLIMNVLHVRPCEEDRGWGRGESLLLSEGAWKNLLGEEGGLLFSDHCLK